MHVEIILDRLSRLYLCGVVYAYICVYTTIIVKEKEAMIMKGSKENTWEGLGAKGEVRI